MSSHHLTDNEISLLKKGLKFTPTPKPNVEEIKTDLKQFTRKLRLKEFFEPNEEDIVDKNVVFTAAPRDNTLVRNKSRFVPARGRNKFLDDFCDTLENVHIPVKKVKRNLNVCEQKGLRSLKENQNIIIKEADKGGAIVILNKCFYHEKITSILNNDEYYNCSSKKEEKAVHNKVKQLVEKFNDEILNKEQEYLTNFEPTSANFYGLPKVHKSKIVQKEVDTQVSEVISVENPEDLTFRPIVGGPASCTQRLSNFIDIILKPLCKHVKSFLRDDVDFLCNLPSNVPVGSLLVSFDVVSLYSNIETELGLEAIKYWIREYRHEIPDRFTEEFIIEALNLVISNNKFYFDGSYYSQKKGVAMGTKVAPTYATLVLGYLEQLFYDKVGDAFGKEMKKQVETSWKRFLDDCFIILKCSENQLQILHEILNSLNPSLTFTMDKSACTINFLDVNVNLNQEGNVMTDIFYKSTDTHQYLDFGSCHPYHTKRNIPYCLARRICTIVSESHVKNVRLVELKRFLLHQNYPEKLIDDSLQKALNLDQQKLRQQKVNIDTEESLALVSTFNPCQEKAISILHRYIPILNQSKKMDKIINKYKIVNSQRQPKNLRRMLTTSKFDSVIASPCVSKCGDKRCLTCKNIIESNSVKINQDTTFIVKQNMDCDTSNVIYVIICNGCNEKYIGKTELKLKRRMNLHRSQIKLPQNRNIPLSEHLDTCGKGCFSVFPLYKLNYKDDSALLQKEQHFIHKYAPKLNAKV